MQERGSDLTIFSPRASFMAHHIGDFNVSSTWAAICNELCFRVSQLFPDHFVPVAMLPQSPGVDPETCIPELEKCVEEYGNVGINLNPDPSGGHWTSPPLSDRHWYPIYEKMVEYDIPAMIHVSTSCNACFHTTGAHYLNADTTAFMQCLTSDLFKDFPTLRFLIPHGGGAVPYHWGRFRGLAQELKKPLLKDHLLNNIFFDTCVYHQPGIDLLTKVIPVDNILFASEMIGAVRGIDPETGHYYDDTKRYIEASTILSARRPAQDLRGQRAARVPAPGRGPESERRASDMYELGVVKRNIVRADKAAVEKLSRFGVATVHEAMGRVGLMKPYMRPIYAGAHDLRHRGHRAAAAGRQLDDARGSRAAAAGRRRGRGLHRRQHRRLLRRPAGDQLSRPAARGLVIDGGVPRRQGPDRRCSSRCGAARSAPRARSRRRSARSTSRWSAPARWSTRATWSWPTTTAWSSFPPR